LRSMSSGKARAARAKYSRCSQSTHNSELTAQRRRLSQRESLWQTDSHSPPHDLDSGINRFEDDAGALQRIFVVKYVEPRHDGVALVVYWHRFAVAFGALDAVKATHTRRSTAIEV